MQSNCEQHFILRGIQERKRLDGREVFDLRNVAISIHEDPGHVEVLLGDTRVLCCVSAAVVEPSASRPTEGFLHFNVELSAMACLQFEPGRPSHVAVEIEQVLERCLRQSRAVDRESLCIVAGEKVWEVRVDCHVLDYCGNIVDCCSIAAITALKHFRRPDVTVIGNEATVHSVLERNPIPLSVHHMPVCVTFAFFTDHTYLLVDPTHLEESVMSGKLIVGINSHREVCVLQLFGGVAVLPDQIHRCIQIAYAKAKDILLKINGALDENRQSDRSVLLHKEKKPHSFKSTLQASKEMKVNVEQPSLSGDKSGVKNEKIPPPIITQLMPHAAYEMGVGGSNMWDLPPVDMEGSHSESEHQTEQMESESRASSKKIKKMKKDKKKRQERSNQEGENGGESEEEQTLELTSESIGWKRKPADMPPQSGLDENSSTDQSHSLSSPLRSGREEQQATKPKSKKQKKKKKA